MFTEYSSNDVFIIDRYKASTMLNKNIFCRCILEVYLQNQPLTNLKLDKRKKVYEVNKSNIFEREKSQYLILHSTN